MNRLLSSAASGRTAAAAAVVGIALLDRLWSGPPGAFYILPVVFLALLDGWPGGVAAAAGCWIAMLATKPAGEFAWASAAALLCAGVLAGVWAGRERRRRKHFENLAAQLSTVYEKVQANFEGMKRAERLSAIGQLSAGLAHEIRNPLASISGAAAILERNRNLEPKHVKCVEIIAKECQRLNGLLTTFLNFARPRPPRFRTVDLNPVLDNVIDLASHAIRSKAIQLEKEAAPDLPPVECDPEQLEQVLLNLMINAIEASPEGANVKLAAVLADGKIGIRVIDRGSGVAPADVDRLFDPFFTTKENGTGLGLPVAHQIVLQMGGSLMAQRNEGEGMTFSVMLPSKERNS